MSEKNSADEKLAKRFRTLNVCVTLLLLLAIFISINQFGTQASSGWYKVALVIPSERNKIGWNYSQYLAVKNVCDRFDCEFILRENVPLDYNSCEKITDELAKNGVKNIYFTNGLKLSDLQTLEKKYPQITFCTIESISALWNGGRYAILSFEGSYLAGILAGLHTKTNKIGYIAPYSDSELNQEINAFTLGVKRVNQNAEVLLNRTGDWDNAVIEEQAVQILKAAQVDVLTYHQNSDVVPNACERAGINFISFNSTYPNYNFFLGAIRIDWKMIYGDLIRYRYSHKDNANYIHGIEDNIVEFETSEKISKREKVAVETAKREIINGKIIFTGDIFDRNNVKKCSANEAISFQSLTYNMDWLIKGVKIVGN